MIQQVQTVYDGSVILSAFPSDSRIVYEIIKVYFNQNTFVLAGGRPTSITFIDESFRSV